MATHNNQTPPPFLPTSPLVLKDQLYTQQITQLFAVAPIGIIASVLTGLILVATLWRVIPQQTLIGWLACVAVINVTWCHLVYRYRKTSPSSTNASYWCTQFILGNLASGCIWGSAGFFLYPMASIPHEIFLTLMLGGMVAGSTAIHSALPNAFFAFSVPTLTPLTLRFFQQGEELHFAIAVMALVYMVMMGFTVRRNHHILLGAMTLRYENTQLLHQVSMARDHLESLVEARTAELKTSETRYRILAENLTDVIWVMAIDGSHFSYISPSIISFLGYTPEEAKAHSLEQMLTPTSAQMARTIFEEELAMEQARHTDPFRSRVLELEHIRKDGATIWAEVRGSILHDEDGHVIGIVGVTRDVTERKKMQNEKQRLEAQLLHAQKIEAIGTLAGGIAHDFNNFLTSILGNISLANYPDTSGHLREKFLSIAEQATLRAKDLTLHLLTFSKGGEPIKQVIALNTVIRESSRFSLSGSSVACEYDLPPDLWPTNVDPGQMSQVFNNLVQNAVQVMPHGGTLTICAENLFLATKATRSVEGRIPLAPGPYIKVSLRDEGSGIADHHLSKIFDPYFTTKSDGHGLGLASVYSIMKKHGGHITVDSELEVGTEFTLFLPASPESQVSREEANSTMKQGSGRVLVMDDDESIRALAGEILTSNGYSCEMVKNGYEAIRQYETALKSDQKYSTVILDLTIPGSMSGIETLRQLKKIDPGVKAIVSSGYAHDPIMADYQNHGFLGFVPKPYSLEKLSHIVYEVVMEPSSQV